MADAEQKKRLDRILCNLGYGSRREMQKRIRAGQVRVEGQTVTDPSFHVDPARASLELNGRQVLWQRYVYLMMNKPAGVISASQGREPCVLDLVQQPVRGLAVCGRLDKDAEGLLLLTNDGPLVHRLLHPRYAIEKEYEVQLRFALTDPMIRLIEAGIGEYRPARIRNAAEKTCTIIVTEGKFHEVKRIFQAAGNEVVHLKRIRLKNLCLDESLQAGEYRPLREAELRDLRAEDPAADPE